VAGGVDNNYSFIYVSGTLTINKAPLTADADDQTKVYGKANPALTITYTGFVNGDNAGDITPPTASTTAITGSNVG
jgi:MBG domain (YGX type)